MGLGEEDRRGDPPFCLSLTGTHLMDVSPGCGNVSHAHGAGLDRPVQGAPDRCLCSALAPLPSFPLSMWTRLGLVLGSWTTWLTPKSPRGGQIQEETLGRTRPGLRSDQSRALACGGGGAGPADRVSGQTWESAHGPFSKAGAVPGAPAGSLGLFHRAHPSLAWPMVEVQI